jgi:hypothetical protein
MMPKAPDLDGGVEADRFEDLRKLTVPRGKKIEIDSPELSIELTFAPVCLRE